MNIKTISILFFLSLFSFYACQKENPPEYNGSDLLLGYWINPQYDNYPIVTYEKSSGLQEDGYGIMFGDQLKFIERKNVGWCGTPPITYGNFDGSWVEADSVLNISVDFWGGTSAYEWKIISLNESQLVLEIISQEFE